MTEDEKSLPGIEDLLLYRDAAEELRRHPEKSLTTVAKDIGRSASVVSVCIGKLETWLGQGNLIERYREGTKVTTPGVQFLAQCETIIDRLKKLRGRWGRKLVEVGCTPNIKANLIVGAIAAHMLLFNSESDLEIQLTPLDTPLLIWEVQRGSFDFAIGWDLPGGAHPKEGTGGLAHNPAYPDLLFKQLGGDEVGYVAVLPEEKIRTCAGVSDYDPLTALWTRATPLADAFPDIASAIHNSEIVAECRVALLADLKDAVKGKRVVAPDTELNDFRDEILRVADHRQLVWVESSEAVLSAVRMYIGDVGWGPEPYLIRRRLNKLLILNAEGKKHGRKLMAYLRTEKGQPTKLSDNARPLLETLHAFMNANWAKVTAGTLDADDVVKWVEARRKETKTAPKATP